MTARALILVLLVLASVGREPLCAALCGATAGEVHAAMPTSEAAPQHSAAPCHESAPPATPEAPSRECGDDCRSCEAREPLLLAATVEESSPTPTVFPRLGDATWAASAVTLVAAVPPDRLPPPQRLLLLKSSLLL